LHATGAIAVDMESAWIAPTARTRTLVTLRVVLDTAERELHHPLRTATGAARAYRALRRACELAEGWASALGEREVVLAAPRASCAGVVRAVQMVEQALEEHGAPVYVRKQIVHNAHVVRTLEERGAVFVDETDEVPEGATVIFSAHGVAPTVREEAARRSLKTIDATCPLVSKVHNEARRFAADDLDIVLIGHEGHEEVVGTTGHAPDRIHLVDGIEEAAAVQVRDPSRVAYLSQTTLSVDETDVTVEALRNRFPLLQGPPSADICYATQNRQVAVKDIAASSELMLVVGSANSSNSVRLVEVALDAGAKSAHLVDDVSHIDESWLDGVLTVGVTSGASVPESLVHDVLAWLAERGYDDVDEVLSAEETLTFALPHELRRDLRTGLKVTPV
ncbi:MAG: 4-hydroxy-3-methylbut-2-en-yl diphosphate reductase, partial [Frankiaceae bacterium]|nr:4-hydroxy-3-methylbut-2-en-yl diphosphate reductase [Frankiaceae bacterium]